MKRFILLGLILLSIGTANLSAQEPLVEKVKKSIDKAISYYRQNQRPDGSWEIETTNAVMAGGWSCLAMLSLLEAGVPLDDPMMAKGLKYVRDVKSGMTYVRALQTMVLARAGNIIDKVKIKENVDWLIEARVMKNKELQGWSYGKGPAQRGDGSNTQYALLGLWAGKEAGINIPEEVWKSIRNHYMEIQEADGSWTYVKGAKSQHVVEELTMTPAGISGLLISGVEIADGREKLQLNGPTLNCGAYKENIPVAKGLQWLENNFSLKVPGRIYYHLYGLERLGRLTGLRFFGSHDWYREGCDFLTQEQGKDGSWQGGGFSDRFTLANTSFALLFLSKGRTPVLISRLVHGTWPRNQADNDWNRDRFAIKHLTEHVSKELFVKKDSKGNVQPLPLAWQIFDLMQAAKAHNGGTTEKALAEITSEMLQSPIIFINGHNAPILTDREKDLLKRYVENGGFIFAEACCGSAGFDQGFRKLVQELWPNNELTKLSPDHPIWRFPAEIPAGSFNLQGLEMGCKTVLVYSPEDMSCLWEAKKQDTARAQLAFRVGANVVAYATGMIPPLPRLTEIEVVSKDKGPAKTPPRFFLKVAQLYHRQDWVPPAPQAMRNLMNHLRKFAGMDVVLNPEKITIDHEDLPNFKFIYFHDRAPFQFTADKLEQLRFNLKTGGLLLADACCGSKKFDESFRKFAKQLFPDNDLQQVPAEDVLFSKDLNGEALTQENIKCRQATGQKMEGMTPWLEGIKINNRWVLLFSKYDLGCALERHQANDCIGYDHDSALRIAGAAILYLMSP